MTRRDARDAGVPATAGAELDGTGARVLDAAVQVLVDFGLKRATAELVAKYAGVSAATVHSRWPTTDGLLQAAVLREFTTVFDTTVRDLDDSGTFDDKVVREFTAVVWSLRNHPLMTRELSTEPETVLPFLTTASAPAMQSALTFVAARLRRSAQASGLNLTDPEALADILIRLAHSVLLVPDPARPLTTRIDIENYASRYIRPVTRYASSGTPGVGAEPEPTTGRHRGPFGRLGKPAAKAHRSAAGVLTAAAVTALVGTAAATSWAAYSGWPDIAPLDSVNSTQPPAPVEPSDTSAPPPSTYVFTSPPAPVTTAPASAKPAPHTVSSSAVSRPPSSTLITVTAAAPTEPLPDSDPKRVPLNTFGGMAPPVMPSLGTMPPHLGSPSGTPGSHQGKPGSGSPSSGGSTGDVPKVRSVAKAHGAK